jgi:hypothetical protein
MATYQIHRLKAHLRQQFRYAPHVSGAAQIKPRDYEPGDQIEAATPYAAFFALKDSASPLEVGDVLDYNGTLQIFKFVGFEQAAWIVVEPKTDPALVGAQPSQPTASLQ